MKSTRQENWYLLGPKQFGGGVYNYRNLEVQT